jgi:hypothetical protein
MNLEHRLCLTLNLEKSFPFEGEQAVRYTNTRIVSALSVAGNPLLETPLETSIHRPYVMRTPW